MDGLTVLHKTSHNVVDIYVTMVDSLFAAERATIEMENTHLRSM
jgi:hypothetical protein